MLMDAIFNPFNRVLLKKLGYASINKSNKRSSFMRQIILFLTFIVSYSALAANPQMPYCSLKKRSAELLEATKTQIEKVVKEHFAKNNIQVWLDLSASEYVESEYSDENQALYHRMSLGGTGFTSTGANLYIVRQNLIENFYGRVNADEVLPDGTLINARCESYTSSELKVINRDTNVTLFTFNPGSAVVYSPPESTENDWIEEEPPY